ncbi:chemotaxis protein CheD [Methanococcoides methylutens]|uniref:Probable chemoreceptor glutamine deamidase CheD n=1 Tax=Methanococcoides methylutens TaxID=2226 RepID=A0A099SYL1_METMT|nr:chemotaxis protein CheD [Methanococcoides methylutens]KGK97982.1 chemotaxis protein CheD [Methanococcoides methylutens]
MSNDIAYVSTANAKAIVLSRNNTVVGSYCSMDGRCASGSCHPDCELIIGAKNHLKGSSPDSNVQLLEGELIAGIGEYKVGKNILLKAMGLGSCVGVVLYDHKSRMAGIAHVLLPGASNDGKTKHAETAITTMLEEMVCNGARRKHISAKVAGGAQIFKHMNLDILKIGDRNIKSVEETLKKEKIEILATDVGGSMGRNVIFNAVDGSLIVKYSNGKVLWM